MCWLARKGDKGLGIPGCQQRDGRDKFDQCTQRQDA